MGICKKCEYKNGETVITAENLNNIQDAILALEEQAEAGGVSDYTELTNKPKINGVEVSGDKTATDYGIGNPTDEQVASSVKAWLDAHPEATTTVADGSVTPEKTDFLRHVKANDPWAFTLEGNGYLGVATVEYLDIKDIEKLIVLVRDKKLDGAVYLACFNESKAQLQGFTVVSNDDNQRISNIEYSDTLSTTFYTVKTQLNLVEVCPANTRYVKVKVASYNSTTESSIQIYTSDYHNGEDFVEWSGKYENRTVKPNSIQLSHTDFVTYHNPNLIDVTNFKSTGHTSDTTDTTHPHIQFGQPNVSYFADYIDVSEKKAVYVRSVVETSVKTPNFTHIACYDADKNFLSRELATTTLVLHLSNATMDDGQAGHVNVHRIDVPDEIAYIRLGRINATAPWLAPYTLVMYENVLRPLALADGYEKVVSDEWAEAVKECVDTTEIYTGVFIGDSLTNWAGGSDVQDGFLKIVHDKTGLVTKNEGLAGAWWQTGGGQTACGVQRVDTLISEGRKYNLYCFILGSNNGSATDTGETSADTSTMPGAIRYCMEKLKAYDPTATILVCLPIQRAEGNETQEKVNAVIKAIAESYGVKTLDLYHHSGIVPNTKVAGVNYLSDGLHLADNGKIALGNLLAAEVKYLLCL